MLYTKDKTHRITLRLNDEQFNYVLTDADKLGISPSEYIRQVLNLSMAMYKEAMNKISTGVLGRENDKTNSNN